MNKFKLSFLAVMVTTALSHTANAADTFVTWNPSYGKVANGSAVAIGGSVAAAGGGSVAIGANNKAAEGARDSTSVGAGTNMGATANHSAAFGVLMNVDGRGSAAFGGESATATARYATALGSSSSATAETSVAVGSNAVASRAAGSFGTAAGAVSFGSTEKTGSTWTSTLGVASLGTDTASRQLTGLAAGSQDNDAVNVAQLKSLQQSSVFGSGASIEIPEDATDPGNVIAARNAVIAARNAVNATVLGDNARVQMDNGVAIGANSVATMEGRTATVQFQPSGTTGGAWASEGLVSFGGSYTNDAGETVNFNRQITGVAAGSEDNDAVNVAQLKEVNNQVQGLVTGDTKVSTIQLTSDPEDASAPTIGLRYQVAEAETAALADGDPVTPTTSQGRLIYNNIDSTGAVIGTETIATLSDGFYVKGGNTAADGTGVKVDLNQGISFLGDEYLQTSVTEGENGGAVVTVGASQALKDFLASSGVQPSEPSNPSNPGNNGGNTGGTWNPNAAQQAALNGNFANGITVAAGEGNQAIQIKQGNVDMGGNRIQNVGNPINNGDAANKAYVDSTSRSLRNKINDVDKDLRAGVAMAMAVGNLPQAYMPGKSIVGLSAGTYHGQGGFALGLSHATENRQWILKGAASVDTRGNFGGTLSAGYQF